VTAIEQGLEDLEIDLLLEGVFRRYGHDFRGYQREPLRHRLHGLMQRDGLRTVSALQEQVLHDPDATNRLLHALTARQAALFDDPGYYQTLRQVLVPWLRSTPTPRIWVADCASAEEVCSLSILLAEEGLQERTQIYATAANEALLVEASSGHFDAERFGEYERNYLRSGGKAALEQYCGWRDGRRVFGATLLSNVTWAQYSLATDASFNEFQLIACRGALSDFGNSLRHRALQLFYDSMPLLGILSLDRADGLAVAPFISRYKPLVVEQGLFQRVM
jgi:chemotaxis protein methyltransferase CheR